MALSRIQANRSAYADSWAKEARADWRTLGRGGGNADQQVKLRLQGLRAAVRPSFDAAVKAILPRHSHPPDFDANVEWKLLDQALQVFAETQSAADCSQLARILNTFFDRAAREATFIVAISRAIEVALDLAQPLSRQDGGTCATEAAETMMTVSAMSQLLSVVEEAQQELPDAGKHQGPSYVASAMLKDAIWDDQEPVAGNPHQPGGRAVGMRATSNNKIGGGEDWKDRGLIPDELDRWLQKMGYRQVVANTAFPDPDWRTAKRVVAGALAGRQGRWVLIDCRTSGAHKMAATLLGGRLMVHDPNTEDLVEFDTLEGVEFTWYSVFDPPAKN